MGFRSDGVSIQRSVHPTRVASVAYFVAGLCWGLRLTNPVGSGGGEGGGLGRPQNTFSKVRGTTTQQGNGILIVLCLWEGGVFDTILYNFRGQNVCSAYRPFWRG